MGAVLPLHPSLELHAVVRHLDPPEQDAPTKHLSETRLHSVGIPKACTMSRINFFLQKLQPEHTTEKILANNDVTTTTPTGLQTSWRRIFRQMQGEFRVRLQGVAVTAVRIMLRCVERVLAWVETTYE